MNIQELHSILMHVPRIPADPTFHRLCILKSMASTEHHVVCLHDLPSFPGGQQMIKVGHLLQWLKELRGHLYALGNEVQRP